MPALDLIVSSRAFDWPPSYRSFSYRDSFNNCFISLRLSLLFVILILLLTWEASIWSSRCYLKADLLPPNIRAALVLLFGESCLFLKLLSSALLFFSIWSNPMASFRALWIMLLYPGDTRPLMLPGKLLFLCLKNPPFCYWLTGDKNPGVLLLLSWLCCKTSGSTRRERDLLLLHLI